LIDYLPTGTLAQRKDAKSILFPRLLQIAPDSNFAGDIYQLCLHYVETGAMDSEDLSPQAPAMVRSFQAWKQKIVDAEMKLGAKWMWEESQIAVREPMGVLLDLMGTVPTDSVRAALKEAIALNDPKLKFFAAISMFRLDMDVPQNELNAIAAADETRLWLFKHLKEQKQLNRMPAEFKTQEALARSSMVEWLIYPTELGRPPDAIEKMGVVTINTPDNGKVDYFVFRFRSDAKAFKDNSWMAGTAGGYVQKDEPTADDTGDTFSTFEKADAKSPAEHVERIRKLIEESWKERAKSAATQP